MKPLITRYLVFLGFGALLLLGMDYYVQHVLSPWNKTAPEEKLNPEELKPEKKEITIPEPAPPPRPIASGCKNKSSRLRFVNYDKRRIVMDFQTCDSILNAASANREKPINGSNMYLPLIRHDAPYLKEAVKTYRKKIDDLKYGKTEAAQMVCASIQSVPYTLIHPFSHRKAERLYPYVKDYHKKMDNPMNSIGGCLENINPYGVMSPLETLFTQKADCDSRTTYLYLILKALGFDVIQLASDAESHAILGINVPKAYGNVFYKYKGKKYYIVETTFYHRKQSRIGVHREGRRYMRSWNLWKVVLE